MSAREASYTEVVSSQFVCAENNIPKVQIDTKT
jgi:hypothetical protein